MNYREFSYQNALRELGEVETVSCPLTEKELYFTTSSNGIYIIDSFGECRDCGRHLHFSTLRNATDGEWPVQYEGAICKECFYNEDAEIKLTEEEKQSLRDSDE